MTKLVRYSGWAACTEKETGEALDRMLLEAVQCILEKAQAGTGIRRILRAELRERRDPEIQRKIVMYTIVCEVEEEP